MLQNPREYGHKVQAACTSQLPVSSPTAHPNWKESGLAADFRARPFSPKSNLELL